MRELRCGAGFRDYSDQRLDGWAIRCWKENGINNLTRAFEVKVSEGDLMRELQNPDKRWMAYALSHEFYFVCPKGLLGKKLLAPDDGLIEVADGQSRIVKQARRREIMPPRWDFVVSLLRR